jgi:hypothetical protein
MQTFVPYPDFWRSVNVLDRQRLGKQRVEAWQIYRALTGQSTGWVNHPATKMWRGFEGALAAYGLFACEAWKTRGYKDSLASGFLDALEERAIEFMSEVNYPDWWGDDRVHSSHRSNLLRKDPDAYGRYGWRDDPTAPYYWPVL